ncbi:unnamed protein product [Meganyctiphanes norvegica]|uniref:Uncharacterized protein n=1 Tax=Meganyctiphanes norvegica TaxID=48144 RepID=A0AAV2Q5W6_MEGNR
MYHSTSFKVRSKLDKADRHSVTTDGWTSLANESYISLTCHYINDEFKLESLVLQTKHMPQSHTAENLLSELETMIKFWNLDTNKKPCFLTDNAKNICKAVNLGNFPHIGCFAHTMNLAVNKALTLSELSSLMGKLHKLVGHFKHSTLESEALKAAEFKENIALLQVIQDGVTQWNSALHMIR